MVEHKGKPAGTVTSGSFCPTLGDNYALALLDIQFEKEDDFEIRIRNNNVQAKRTQLPFYKKRYKKQEV
jgi:aminomethyltransferase